jgi:hypothetical protein
MIAILQYFKPNIGNTLNRLRRLKFIKANLSLIIDEECGGPVREKISRLFRPNAGNTFVSPHPKTRRA